MITYRKSHTLAFNMVVISYRKIREFSKEHPSAYAALDSWFKVTEASDWANFHQVKKTFNSVDAVGNDRYVFNIKGNSFRLVALVAFNVRTVYILFIGTHAEYDRIDPSTILLNR